MGKRDGYGELTAEQVTFYGLRGERLAMYQRPVTGGVPGTFALVERKIYFGGRLMQVQPAGTTQGKLVVTDRLGSVAMYGVQSAERLRYFPYGEERPSATTQGREKFGTYLRDEGGIDYAMNRYYDSPRGRFLTPDPYVASGGAAVPGSWNRYSYVMGDPVNLFDPPGLNAQAPGMVCFYVDGVYDSCEYAFGDGEIGGGAGGGYFAPDPGGEREGEGDGGGLGTGGGASPWSVLNDLKVESCSFGERLAMECGDQDGSFLLGAGLGWNALGRLTGTFGMAWYVTAQAVGRAGEAVVKGIVNLEKNRFPIPDFNRIPDFWRVRTNTIIEVKNTSYVSFSGQIKDMATWAARTPGASFELYVNQNATLSSELLKARDAGLIILKYFKWP